MGLALSSNPPPSSRRGTPPTIRHFVAPPAHTQRELREAGIGGQWRCGRSRSLAARDGAATERPCRSTDAVSHSATKAWEQATNALMYTPSRGGLSSWWLEWE